MVHHWNSNRIEPTSLAGTLILFCSISIIASIFYYVFAIPHNTPAPAPIGYEKKVQECNSLNDDGKRYLREGHLHEAESAFSKALSLHITVLNPLICENYAQALAQGKKFRMALAAYAIAYNSSTLEDSNFPGHLEGLIRYALLCIHTGRWAQAVQVDGWAVQYMTLPPDSPLRSEVFSATVPRPMDMDAMIHVMQAVELDKRGKTYEALTALQQAQSLAPNAAVVYYYKGLTLRQRGRRAEAQAAFQKAADLGSGDVKTAAEAALKGR